MAITLKSGLTKADRDAASKLAAQAAREDLLAMAMLLNHDFSVGPHHRVICDELMDFEKGKTPRLMIFAPPRSTKSWLSSTYYPAYSLGKHPNWQTLSISHSEDLATRAGRDIRNMIMGRPYQTIFPNVAIKKGHGAANLWGTDQGGTFMAAGVGGNIAGWGAHQALIDDPISEQDAFSKAARDRVNTWFPGGLRSRLMPGGRICLINTRWNEADLAGFLLEQQENNLFADKWKVVSIPALNTPESAAMLNAARLKLIEQGYLPDEYPELQVGESYWPAGVKWRRIEYDPEEAHHWPTQILLETKGNMPEYQWDAIYMQNPTSPEGGIFKVSYWQEWTDPNNLPRIEYKVLSLDTAYSAKKSADFSAMTLWGVWANERGEQQLMLMGAQKGRWEYPELRRRIEEWYEKHRPQIILVEKASSGQSLLPDLKLLGLPVYPYQPDKDKEARAHFIAPMMAQGLVWYPTGRKWAQDVIDECRAFPSGAHDDYVDTVTQVLIWMRDGGFIVPKDSPWNEADLDDNLMGKRSPRRFY